MHIHQKTVVLLFMWVQAVKCRQTQKDKGMYCYCQHWCSLFILLWNYSVQILRVGEMGRRPSTTTDKQMKTIMELYCWANEVGTVVWADSRKRQTGWKQRVIFEKVSGRGQKLRPVQEKKRKHHICDFVLCVTTSVERWCTRLQVCFISKC